MTKHTSGPWMVERDSDSDSESAGAVFQIYAHSGPPHNVLIPVGTFLDVRGRYNGDAEEYELSPDATANARLIAAAPEMLALLRELEWKAGNVVAAQEAIGRTANGLKTACEQARTLLARLDGGDNG